ncbi:MAG: DNA-directed RNA polymerase subunit omega [Acidobacteriaceae bacterium]
MRSELIFGALTHVNNRYQLCQLASKATRKLHKPNTRLQDTMNDVLVRFRDSDPAAAAAAVAAARAEAASLPQQQRRAA